jgi:hypothetical protein
MRVGTHGVLVLWPQVAEADGRVDELVAVAARLARAVDAQQVSRDEPAPRYRR